MSKNFEEDYKNMVAGDLPDLWDRIEAGLHEKEVKEVKTVTAAEAKTVPPVKKKKTIYKILPWAGAIATAALVLIVAIPAVILVNRITGMKNSAPAAMTTNMNYVVQEAEDAAFEEPAGGEMTENAVMPGNFAYDGSTMGFKGTEELSGLAQERDGKTGGERQTVTAKEDRKGKQEETVQPENTQEENSVNRVYANVLEVYEKDGKTYCTAEISDKAEDFKSDLAIEAGEFVISSGSEAKVEPFSLYVAVLDDDELNLLFRMEQ